MESGIDLFVRLQSRKRPSIVALSPEIIPKNGPMPGEIVEICGDTGSGKTIHTMEFIAQAVIPVEYGGKGAGVIVIDTNSNFHVPNLLAKILEKHIVHSRSLTCKSTDTEDLRDATSNVEDVVLDAMKKIVFFKCYSGVEFDLTLVYCSSYLTTHSDIGLMVIDSIANFYWSDLEDQQLVRMETYFQRYLQELRKITDESKIVMMYTRPAKFGNSDAKHDEKINYKIQLKHFTHLREMREASNYYCNRQSSRRFIINDFGIQWLSSADVEQK